MADDLYVLSTINTGNIVSNGAQSPIVIGDGSTNDLSVQSQYAGLGDIVSNGGGGQIIIGDGNTSKRYGPYVEMSIGGNVYTTGANSGVDISEGKGLYV